VEIPLVGKRVGQLMTLEAYVRPEEPSFPEMRAHFSRHEPRVGPCFRKARYGMHFHNVDY